ncbi:hypothetical protein QUF80_22925 [Desulfococcaceae bacterium HSG8]|nr:hypothetical protein [Desulfococcaceae bacterium HSG8]
MKFFESDHEKLRKSLVAACRGKENAEPGERWQEDVMNHIRTLGPLLPETNYFILFDQFVWRFAAAACFLAIILSAYVLQTGFQPEYEIAKLFLDNPVELTFTQYFGI